MRIQESRTFTMELSAEEFELLHPICNIFLLRNVFENLYSF